MPITTQEAEEGTRKSLTSAHRIRVLVVDDVVSASVSCGEGCAPLCCCLRATFSSFRTVVLAVGFVGLFLDAFLELSRELSSFGFLGRGLDFECCGSVLLFSRAYSEENAMSRVYVGNLDPRATERELEDEFRVYGVLRRFAFFSLSTLFLPWSTCLLLTFSHVGSSFFLLLPRPFPPFPFRFTTLTSLAEDSRRTHLSQNHYCRSFPCTCMPSVCNIVRVRIVD